MDPESAVRLRRAVNHLSRRFNASATDEGLTPSQASTLALITARGPLPLAEVARLDSLNPTMVSRIVGALEGAGLVERTKAANDLRSYSVAATAVGRQTHERIREQRVASILDAARHLTPAQQTAVLGALDALDALAAHMP